MKKIIFLFSILLLSNCGGIKQTSGGLDNVGFLSVFGDPQKYPGGVVVVLDNGSPTVAEVISASRAARKVELPSVKIASGKHSIKVSHQGKVIYQRQIFLSSQETYKVELP